MPREYVDLIASSLEKVCPQYYRLITTYDRNGIVRERLFCYELYHQIRLKMQRGEELTLHAEIDKRGHQDFQEEHRKNPDFVFHVQGTHDFNTLVIEVKGTLKYDEAEERRRYRATQIPEGRINRPRREPSTAINDLKTILVFINNYGYRAGIFILYNHSFAELYDVVGYRLEELSVLEGADSVYILTISPDNRRCDKRLLSDIHNPIED
ncbi:MAG: hypothetical protein JOZ51_19275 [Chloroflexi bacterium]|nr:hypothetical protein [Chloroflexota bacterium]